MQQMAKQEKETVRRVLKAALDKLDEESHGDKESSNSIVFSESDTGAPVILLLAGGLIARDEDVPAALVAAATGRHESGEATDSSFDQTRGANAAHPGLERFPLAVTTSLPTAPKACFMEPGRTCVSSGACEMRGF